VYVMPVVPIDDIVNIIPKLSHRSDLSEYTCLPVSHSCACAGCEQLAITGILNLGGTIFGSSFF